MTDLETGSDGAISRKEKAKEVVGQAGQVLKAEAQSFASAAQERVRTEAQKGAQVGARTLGDFANAVRRAGDELSQSDQSPASHLVRQAADGLESLSRNLADKDPGDLLNSVRDFGRRNPAAFIGGAVLVGLALGRFARASEVPDATMDLAEEDLSFTDSYETAPVIGAGAIETSPGLADGSLDDPLNAPESEGFGGLDSDASTSPHSGSR